jgi:hypothetical protein
MKNRYIATGLAILLALASGCSKSEQEKLEGDAKQLKDKTADAATKVEDAAKQAKDKAVEVKDRAQSALQAAGGNNAQGILDKAQSLVDSKQYQPALDTLAKLKDIKLTDAQQKMVDDLKAKIQKLMAADAAGSAGGLLGK